MDRFAIRLSEAGERYATAGRRVLAELEEAERQAITPFRAIMSA